MSEEQPVPPPVPQPPQQPVPPAFQPAAPQGQTQLPLLALIFGIGGFFFSLLCSIPAIVLGIMGRKKAKELNQPTSMATAGLTLGIIVTAISVLSIILLIPILGLATTNISNSSTAAERAMAKGNVISIATMIRTATDTGYEIIVTPTTLSYSGETGMHTIDLAEGTKIRKIAGDKKYEVCQPVPVNNPTIYVHMTTDSSTPSETTTPC